jgi:hypothetical protein
VGVAEPLLVGEPADVGIVLAHGGAQLLELAPPVDQDLRKVLSAHWPP